MPRDGSILVGKGRFLVVPQAQATNSRIVFRGVSDPKSLSPTNDLLMIYLKKHNKHPYLMIFDGKFPAIELVKLMVLS